MTDPIATLRRYIPHLPSVAQSTATQAVDAMEAELTALRESALDLSRVPDGWVFHELSNYRWKDGAREYRVQLEKYGVQPYEFMDGTGPTPAAALSAAIERAKETT